MKFRRSVTVLLFAIIGIILFPTVASSQASDDTSIEQTEITVLESHLIVSATGSLKVEEKISVRWNGPSEDFERKIPLVGYLVDKDPNEDTILPQYEITEVEALVNNEKVPSGNIKTSNDSVNVVFPATEDKNTKVEYSLSYEVPNALLAAPEYTTKQFMYWNVTGGEWSIPIKHLNVTVVTATEPQKRLLNFNEEKFKFMDENASAGTWSSVNSEIDFPDNAPLRTEVAVYLEYDKAISDTAQESTQPFGKDMSFMIIAMVIMFIALFGFALIAMLSELL